ncbi:hypothetical protein OROGR_013014 [Orobanche gracilis]
MQLLCPNEEIRDHGNMMLDSRENRDESVEEEHEELQGKKSNTEWALEEEVGKRWKKCVKKEK